MDLRSSEPEKEQRDGVAIEDVHVSPTIEGEKSKQKKDPPSFSEGYIGK